ncbi:hypothetical protein BH11PSE11_BH11PSE11_34430 [soil metagenome]
MHTIVSNPSANSSGSPADSLSAFPADLRPACALDLHGLIVNLALACAAVVFAMLSVFLLTGIGQDPLQSVHAPAEYATILLRNPAMLRTVIGLDNLFIVLYASLFLTLGSALSYQSKRRAMLVASIGLLLLSGLLDLLENMHFMTMLAAAEHGLEIGAPQIELQVCESLAKFHLSYLGLFLLGFVLPNTSRLERALCLSMRWLQLLVGLLIYLVPKQLAIPLVLTRFSFFLFALLAMAAIFRRRKSGSGAPE